MTQKDKKLLLIDLCSRLPYGVKCYVEFDDGKVFPERTLMPIMIQDFKNHEFVIYKPYLRLLSSMTEEEFKYFMGLRGRNLLSHDIQQMMKETFNMPNSISVVTNLGKYLQNVNWLLSKHFDVYGLIEKGLAIKVAEDNDPYK